MKYKLVHTCIRVMDLEKSLKFYKEALGFVESKRMDYPEWKFTLVFLKDEEGHHEVELTYNYDQETPYEVGNGFSHLAVVVEDLEASMARHKEMGYPIKGYNERYYFITDPDGYDIEVIREK